ncbi:MAG: hypothetical protein KKD38_06615 [Candidatus Delongbacteria bacterium]|nr:hypothetical protein [Candidatus Delongbacteria bacterium]
MFFSKPNIIKYCEHCGEIASDPNFVLVGLMGDAILKRSNRILRTEGKKVILNDGTFMRLDFENDREYFSIANGHEHVFCSDICVDKLLKNNIPYVTDGILNEGINYTSIGYNFVAYNSKISSLGTIAHKSESCEVCGTTYPSINREWLELFRITRTIIKDGYYNEDPFEKNGTQERLVVSGLSQDKIQFGPLYCYEMNPSNKVSHKFCSYDCAYYYTKKNNTVIMTTSIIEKSRKGLIVPHIEEVNAGLGRRPKHKPIFIANM